MEQCLEVDAFAHKNSYDMRHVSSLKKKKKHDANAPFWLQVPTTKSFTLFTSVPQDGARGSGTFTVNDSVRLYRAPIVKILISDR